MARTTLKSASVSLPKKLFGLCLKLPFYSLESEDMVGVGGKIGDSNGETKIPQVQAG